MYHQKEKIFEADAVETAFCQPLFKTPKARSTPQQLSMFAQIASGSHRDSQKMIEMQYEGNLTFKAYLDRINTFPIKYDFKLQLWIPTHYAETGMKGVLLMAYYLQWFAFSTKKIKKLSFSYMAEHIFCDALPTATTLFKLWDEQKVKADPPNLIDYASAVQSFMPGYDIDWKI